MKVIALESSVASFEVDKSSLEFKIQRQDAELKRCMAEKEENEKKLVSQKAQLDSQDNRSVISSASTADPMRLKAVYRQNKKMLDKCLRELSDLKKNHEAEKSRAKSKDEMIDRLKKDLQDTNSKFVSLQEEMVKKVKRIGELETKLEQEEVHKPPVASIQVRNNDDALDDESDLAFSVAMVSGSHVFMLLTA